MTVIRDLCRSLGGSIRQTNEETSNPEFCLFCLFGLFVCFCQAKPLFSSFLLTWRWRETKERPSAHEKSAHLQDGKYPVSIRWRFHSRREVALSVCVSWWCCFCRSFVVVGCCCFFFLSVVVVVVTVRNQTKKRPRAEAINRKRKSSRRYQSKEAGTEVRREAGGHARTFP